LDIFVFHFIHICCRLGAVGAVGAVGEARKRRWDGLNAVLDINKKAKIDMTMGVYHWVIPMQIGRK
jgi:hypothetical protein